MNRRAAPASADCDASAVGSGDGWPIVDPSPVDGRRLTLSLADDVRCEWCHHPVKRAARRDSITCSQECRQAKARFRVAPATTTAATPLRWAYADPPYPGCAWRYYRKPEVNHAILVGTLERDFPEGWALSTSAAGLQQVLAVCPPGVRVAVWVNGPRRGVAHRARTAYEAVIMRGGRELRLGPADDLSNVLHYQGRQRSHPDALTGMKPAPFLAWLFRMMGAQRGDQLVDVFPGSGAVARAWTLYNRPAPTPRKASRRTSRKLEPRQLALLQAGA